MSLAGLRSLHELLMVYSSSSTGDGSANTVIGPTTNDLNLASTGRQEKNGQLNKIGTHVLPHSEVEIWACTWTVWMRIATAATAVMATVENSPIVEDDRRRREYPQPQHQSLQHKQQFLTALLQIFPLIFTRIKTRSVH